MINGKVFHLELTPQAVDVIGKALGQMPYNMVAPVVAELQRQIDEQEKKEKKNGPSLPA